MKQSIKLILCLAFLIIANHLSAQSHCECRQGNGYYKPGTQHHDGRDWSMASIFQNNLRTDSAANGTTFKNNLICGVEYKLLSPQAWIPLGPSGPPNTCYENKVEILDQNNTLVHQYSTSTMTSTTFTFLQAGRYTIKYTYKLGGKVCDQFVCFVNVDCKNSQSGISNIPKCFCCGDAYNLNAPLINGPDVIDCKGTFKWTWDKCEGTKVVAGFSPNPLGSTAWNDNVSTSLNLTSAWSGTTVLTVTFICGDKKVSIQKKITIKPCCDCSKLPAEIRINGPQYLCLTDSCNETLTYAGPRLDDTCYKYQWSVSPSVNFSGQGTNLIRFNCKELKAGTYKITLTIKCGDKTVTSTMPLVVCAKPNALFGRGGTFPILTGTATYPATNDYWVLVEDKDKSCDWSTGDIIVNPPGTTTGAVFNYNNLAFGKQYVLYHLSLNNCGNNRYSCSSIFRECIVVPNPPSIIKNPNGPKPEIKITSLSTLHSENISILPKALLNSLPKEVLEGLEKK